MTEYVSVPRGWKLVPDDRPTPEMINAVRPMYDAMIEGSEYPFTINLWRALLGAAPTPPSSMPEAWELEAAAVFMDHVEDDETGSVHRVATYLRSLASPGAAAPTPPSPQTVEAWPFPDDPEGTTYWREVVGGSYTPVKYSKHMSWHPVTVKAELEKYRGEPVADVLAGLVFSLTINRAREVFLLKDKDEEIAELKKAPPSPPVTNEVVEALRRVTDHLETWAGDHAGERTSETDAAIYCARAALASMEGRS